MSKKVPDNTDKNKPESMEERLKQHYTVVPVGIPSEAQLRMMSIHLWMMDVARDPEGLPIFLALEDTARHHGYNPTTYRNKAESIFALLRTRE